jgi:hypothetical protein
MNNITACISFRGRKEKRIINKGSIIFPETVKKSSRIGINNTRRYAAPATDPRKSLKKVVFWCVIKPVSQSKKKFTTKFKLRIRSIYIPPPALTHPFDIIHRPAGRSPIRKRRTIPNGPGTSFGHGH